MFTQIYTALPERPPHPAKRHTPLQLATPRKQEKAVKHMVAYATGEQGQGKEGGSNSTKHTTAGRSGQEVKSQQSQFHKGWPPTSMSIYQALHSEPGNTNIATVVARLTGPFPMKHIISEHHHQWKPQRRHTEHPNLLQNVTTTLRISLGSRGQSQRRANQTTGTHRTTNAAWPGSSLQCPSCFTTTGKHATAPLIYT